MSQLRFRAQRIATGFVVLLSAAVSPKTAIAAPKVCFIAAERYSMPDCVDSNIPATWVDNAGTPNLRIFESGPDPPFPGCRDTRGGPQTNPHMYLQTARLTEPGTSARFELGGNQWLEGVVRDPTDPTFLWGYYHSEELVPPCPSGFPSPRIGALYSLDDGTTWTRVQGGSEWVLQPPITDVNCSADNGQFVSGNTDPTVILDESVDPIDLHRYIYLVYVNAGGPTWTQGISAARVAIDTGDPTIAQKWDGAGWTGIGDGGPSVPLSADFNIIPRVTDWNDTYQADWSLRNPQSWYTPAVFYNTKLQKYVLLVTHTVGGEPYFGTDTGWISFSDSLSQPNWSRPELIDTQAYYYYIQMIGLGPLETGSRIGEEARYFRGFNYFTYASDWIAHFYDDENPEDPPPEGCISPVTY